MADPKKHHFLPVFYLKNWADVDDKLVEFSRPYNNIVRPRRKHPPATGYIEKLYAIEGLHGSMSQEVEKNFLSPVDSRAASALKMMLEGGTISPQQRKAWAGFILTLLLRMPTEIDLLKQFIRTVDAEVHGWINKLVYENVPDRYHSQVEAGLRELKESMISRHVEHVLRVMSNEDLVDRIIAMNWQVIDTRSSPNELLTSDRPVVVFRNDETAGNTVIALPVGPHRLFVAATASRLIAELQGVGAKRVTDAMNLEVVAGASRFVYGRSDRQIRFVQNRFGTNKSVYFVADILQKANWDIKKLASILPRYDAPEIRAKISEAIAFAEAHQQSSRNE